MSSPPPRPAPEVVIGGMRMTTASRRGLVDQFVADANERRSSRVRTRPKVVVDANGHALSLYASDTGYRAAVDAADLVHADGGFLITASRWLTDRPIHERSATTDLIHDFAAAAASHGLGFYLYGATEAINADCAAVLAKRYPGLRIVGRHHGYTDDLDSVADDIVRTGPDVVWVGLGKPREQVAALALRERVDAAWIVTCGGCFNFVTGAYRRAPAWMQRTNLEWVHRLATQPRKLFWRYLVTTPHALYLTLTRTQRNAVRG